MNISILYLPYTSTHALLPIIGKFDPIKRVTSITLDLCCEDRRENCYSIPTL